MPPAGSQAPVRGDEHGAQKGTKDTGRPGGPPGPPGPAAAKGGAYAQSGAVEGAAPRGASRSAPQSHGRGEAVGPLPAGPDPRRPVQQPGAGGHFGRIRV